MTKSQGLFFHLEGLDRCGKTTVANLFVSELYIQYRTVANLIHSSYPPKHLQRVLSPQELSLFADRQLNQQFSIYDKPVMINIMDRSWVGENVYGKLYRNRVNDYVYNGNKNLNVYILFFDEPSSILSRDDGKSTFKTEQDVIKELNMFKDALGDQSLVLYADASLYDETAFHKIIVNIMLDIQLIYYAYNFISEDTFMEILEPYKFALGGKYDKR